IAAEPDHSRIALRRPGATETVESVRLDQPAGQDKIIGDDHIVIVWQSAACGVLEIFADGDKPDVAGIIQVAADTGVIDQAAIGAPLADEADGVTQRGLYDAPKLGVSIVVVGPPVIGGAATADLGVNRVSVAVGAQGSGAVLRFE